MKTESFSVSADTRRKGIIMSEYTFYSAFPGSRPVRCSEKTRKFAWDSLHAVYGLETKEHMAVEMDDVQGFADMSPYDKYDAMIYKIASESPLRICENELICGSASLGYASHHVIPAIYGGNIVQGSVSHITCGFDRVLREGLNSYEARINERLTRQCDDNQKRYLQSLLNTIAAIKIWHGRYLALIDEKRSSAENDEEKSYYGALYDNLKNVPFEAPKSFREGVQALWFLFAFTRLCGNWSGIGRIDMMLGKLYNDDVSRGKITEEEARELIAHFFIKGCEWIKLDSRGSGDAQHYQNIVLAGCDSEGSSIINPVTYLVLDVVEEFPISDYPIAVRINPDTPAELLRKIAEVMKHGSGVCAVYNERLIIDSLVEFGYKPEEARLFANDGCWEVQIPGKTFFSYCPMDAEPMLQNDVFGLNDDDERNYGSFDEMVVKFDKAVAELVERWQAGADGYGNNPIPESVVSLFEDDCIENARDYYNNGTRYRAYSPHLGGMPDVANELYAVKKLVFDEKKVTFDELRTILKNNWEGAEDLRRYVRNSYTYYGNDNDECDDILVHIMDNYMNEVRKVKERNGVFRPCGISTFGRQIDWKDSRMAHAHGFFRGDILASNLSPTPTTDKTGATAIIRSHCKVDYSKLTCGTALDIKLDPTSVKGEDGTEAIMSLLDGFMELGGFFMQIDVMDNAVLLEAQKHPENYQNLSVRVSGWSARFVTLDENWQRMIIERT